MLDIKLIREQPDWVRGRLAARGAGDEASVAELLALDEERRRRLAEVEKFKAERNRISKEIGSLIAEGKTHEAEERKIRVRELSERVAGGDAGIKTTGNARDQILLRLPNLPQTERPFGPEQFGQCDCENLGGPPAGRSVSPDAR